MIPKAFGGQLASQAMIATFALVSLLASARLAFADDYADCVAAYERYNQNIEGFQLAADDLERTPYCLAISPETGYAACQRFMKSGAGTTEQSEWASKLSSSLASVYKTCKAQ